MSNILFIILLEKSSADVQGVSFQPLTDKCLDCICQAISLCNLSLKCDGDVCGPYRITWGYWFDSGAPVISGDSSNNDGGKIFK